MGPDKIRVLQMTPQEVNNGVYKYVFGYLPYLDNKEYDVGFLTRGYEELNRIRQQKKYSFKIHPFLNTQRDNAKGLEQEVRKVLSEYDIIHLHTSSWRGFMIENVAMEMGLDKVIVHSHSTGIDISDDKERDKQIREHFTFRSEFGEKYATDCCACSMKAADWLFGTSVDYDKVQIMPNAINLSRYTRDENVRWEIRNYLGVHDKYVIGNVGRYSFQKNQEFLIEVMAMALKENSELYLICVGQGPELEKCAELADVLGISNSVRLMSWSNEISRILQSMDLFCLPSRFEGLGISLVEAQAVGLKCIASDHVPEEANVSGYIEYLPLNKECWKERILYNAEKGYEFFDNTLNIKKAGYDINDAADRLLRLYQM